MNNYYIFLLLSGNLIFSSLPLFLQTNTGEDASFLNYFRIIIIFFSLSIFFNGIIKNKRSYLSTKFLPLYIFLGIYFVRLIFDLFLVPISFLKVNLNIDYIYTPIFYFSQFFGIIILPTLGILFLDTERINFKKIFNLVYTTTYFILLCSLFFLYQNLNIGEILIRSTSGLTLSELTYGHYGAMLSILSLYKILKIKGSNKVLSSAGFVIGILTIMVSGSRSPLLALFLITIYMIYNQFTLQKLTLFIGFIFVLGYNYLLDLLQFINTIFPNAFADRVLVALQYGSEGSVRGDMLFAGLNEFFKSPFFGSGFLIQAHPFEGSYPHNLAVEAFMATGVLGGLVFLFLNFRALQLVNLMKNTEKFWLGLLFIQFFIFSMFSGNLYTSFFYWMFLTLVLVVNYKIKLIKG